MSELRPPPYASQPHAASFQQPGYYPPPASNAQPTEVIVVSQPTTAVYLPAFGDHAIQTTCPNCHRSVVTQLRHEVGGFTWLVVGILCVIGCWPCCLIPFCVDSCQDTVHICPSCQTVLGRRRLL